MKEKITLLGQFIVHERRKCGAGVAEFCRVAGINKDTYYHILCGKM